MRTVIDLTDEVSPNAPMELPDPSVIEDDGDVVIRFCETEMRMSYEQFLGYTMALDAWKFRGRTGVGRDAEGDLKEDGDDLNACLGDEEHEVLRGIVSAIARDGELDGFPVPSALRDAVKARIRKRQVMPTRWRTLVTELVYAKGRIRELVERVNKHHAESKP